MRRFIVTVVAILGVVYWLGSTNKPVSMPVEVNQPETLSFSIDASASKPELPQPSPASQATKTINPALVSEPVTKEMFIRGKRVALRDGPGTQFKVLDRYDSGRAVLALLSEGEWTRVRDRLTQRDGWVSSHLLQSSPPAEPAKKEDVQPKKNSQESQISIPRISDATIVQRIIAESINGYAGSCPCPESRDRGGRRCGKRSAYSKPGGASPICYYSDVSREMIEAFRARL
ncbi:SH3 domain-containing protein [Rhizobium sp. TRM96647]|uniref:SH3 domain-containing protein n=1 Tax=unclassified Rhizobium TaxID=2613769 RepID=UPI0021E99811|nr:MULTISPECIES: SH3 domain-containing protein [unclassified Rhizobium]MCV3734975.1 SH3 domain-containing protein [Rhizobium sp. TRM96647]MCV3757345.1 SH3 domain-containing protein [Rhizobium sp. TRM96650]